jgi:hypothetical protein
MVAGRSVGAKSMVLHFWWKILAFMAVRQLILAL